ncbi:hypothetical protein [Aquabacterium sp.]|uniref:phage adaptor protein n=1 Tax=Aquabacterium sp. TaxID=1872578 RepID=UPI0025C61267|nr:hypothetical protein [Aquabacterium sp.]
MPGTMSEADLVVDLKASLFDAANVFTDPTGADFKRFLAQALPDMQTKRPVTRLGTLTLVADQARYAVAEADFAALKTDIWRNTARLPKPWEPTWPGGLPRICEARDGGAWYIQFDPAPTALHLAALGETFRFYYFAAHAIGALAADTTVNPQDRGLLLLRAQAEAMLALGLRNAGKPVQLRDGLSGTPRNSTPAALHELLLRLFKEAR